MGWYVYGVTDAGAIPAIPGIADAPVELVGGGDVRLVASRHDHPVDERDTAAVIAMAERHDEVLRTLAARWSVVPVRFGTRLPDDHAVAALLSDRDGALAAALASIADADEWVVEVHAPPVPDAPADADPDLSPGQAFFARRRAADQAVRDARAAAVAAAEDLHARLMTLARSFTSLDLRDRDVVARGAYLVPRAAADDFVAVATAVSLVGLQGPLPAYRFVGS